MSHSWSNSSNWSSSSASCHTATAHRSTKNTPRVAAASEVAATVGVKTADKPTINQDVSSLSDQSAASAVTAVSSGGHQRQLQLQQQLLQARSRPQRCIACRTSEMDSDGDRPEWTSTRDKAATAVVTTERATSVCGDRRRPSGATVRATRRPVSAGASATAAGRTAGQLRRGSATAMRQRTPHTTSSSNDNTSRRPTQPPPPPPQSPAHPPPSPLRPQTPRRSLCPNRPTTASDTTGGRGRLVRSATSSVVQTAGRLGAIVRRTQRDRHTAGVTAGAYSSTGTGYSRAGSGPSNDAQHGTAAHTAAKSIDITHSGRIDWAQVGHRDASEPRHGTAAQSVGKKADRPDDKQAATRSVTNGKSTGWTMAGRLQHRVQERANTAGAERSRAADGTDSTLSGCGHTSHNSRTASENNKSSNDKPVTKSVNKSSNDKPVTKPVNKSSNDKPVTKPVNKSSNDKPVTKPVNKSSNDKPVTKPVNKSSNDKPVTKPVNKSSNDKPVTKPVNKSSNDKLVTKSVNKSSNDKLVTKPVNKSSNDKPVTKPVNKSSNDKLVNKSSNDKPVNKSSNDKPVNKSSNDKQVTKPVSKSSNDKLVNKSSNDKLVNKSSNDKPVNKSSNDKPVTKPATRKPKSTPSPTFSVENNGEKNDPIPVCSTASTETSALEKSRIEAKQDTAHDWITCGDTTKEQPQNNDSKSHEMRKYNVDNRGTVELYKQKTACVRTGEIQCEQNTTQTEESDNKQQNVSCRVSQQLVAKVRPLPQQLHQQQQQQHQHQQPQQQQQQQQQQRQRQETGHGNSDGTRATESGQPTVVAENRHEHTDTSNGGRQLLAETSRHQLPPPAAAAAAAASNQIVQLTDSRVSRRSRLVQHTADSHTGSMVENSSLQQEIVREVRVFKKPSTSVNYISGGGGGGSCQPAAAAVEPVSQVEHADGDTAEQQRDEEEHVQMQHIQVTRLTIFQSIIVSDRERTERQTTRDTDTQHNSISDNNNSSSSTETTTTTWLSPAHHYTTVTAAAAATATTAATLTDRKQHAPSKQ